MEPLRFNYIRPSPNIYGTNSCDDQKMKTPLSCLYSPKMRRSSENYKFTENDDDEIIDLRQLEQNVTGKKSDKKFSFKQKINAKPSKTELNAGDHKSLNASFKNLPGSFTTHFDKGGSKLQRAHSPGQRNRRRPLNRATSADPRFRKPRSPDRKASASASEVTLISPSLNNQNVQSGSVSTPVLKRKPHYNRSSTEEKSIKSVGKLDNKSEQDDVVAAKGDELVNEEVACKVKEITENENPNSNFKSDALMKYEFGVPKIITPQSISPYWDDPRLLRKYSDLLKMSHLRRTKSTWTLPICTSKQVLMPLEEPSCTHILERDTYKYDEGTDISSINAVILQRPNFLDVAKKNCCLVFFFSLGSCIGILLATILIYFFVTTVLPWCLSFTKTEQTTNNNKNPIYRLLLYVVGSALYLIDSLIKSIIHLLFLQRAEIYQTTPSTSTPWYQQIFAK